MSDDWGVWIAISLSLQEEEWMVAELGFNTSRPGCG
jgi:hypothetical protein